MSEMMGALRGKVTTAPPGFEAFAPVEAEAAAAPAYIGVPSPCFGRRTSPTDLLVPGGKRNHDLSALWKGRRTIAGEHRCKRRPWAKPVTSKQKSPICHLTSQWSGRLRAARFGAAHRRVIRQRVIAERREAEAWRRVAWTYPSLLPSFRACSSRQQTPWLGKSVIRHFAEAPVGQHARHCKPKLLLVGARLGSKPLVQRAAPRASSVGGTAHQ